MNPKDSSKMLRKFRYSFEAMVDEVRINVKFPCRISLSWNYGDGEAKTVSAKQLVNGIAQFNDKLHFSVLISYEEETKRYLEFKTTMEIMIITDNGTSLAGFVPLDLGAMVTQKSSNRELFDIERCPDKGAQVKMRVAHRYLSEAPAVNIANRVNNRMDEDQLDAYDNRSITPRSEYVPKTEYMKKPPGKLQVGYANPETSRKPSIPAYNATGHFGYQSSTIIPSSPQGGQHYAASVMNSPTGNNQQPSKNKQILEKEIYLLKSRATEYENKFKHQRVEKEQLNQLLKNKEEVYFTLKTEIKRKQIQLEDLYKNLQEYRSEYERVRAAEDRAKRQCEGIQAALINSERAFSEKINKMESEINLLEKKLQKLNQENQRLKVERDSAIKAGKKEAEDLKKQKQAQAQLIKTGKREKEELLRAHRLQKDGLERNIRDMTKQNKELSEIIETLKDKIATLEKKTIRSQQIRSEDVQKYSLKITEVQRVRETLTVELDNLRTAATKKETSLTETIRILETKLSEEKNSVQKLKTNVNELQIEKTTAQKEVSQLKETVKALEDHVRKQQKQLMAVRGQIPILTEQLQAKVQEAKTLSSRVKELTEELARTQAKGEETLNQTSADLNKKLKELKKAEETKLMQVNKKLAKKTQELEEALTREQKLMLQNEQLKQDLGKLQSNLRERAEQAKKQEAQLRSQIVESHKKAERKEEILGDKITNLSKQLEQSEYTARHYMETIQRLNLKEQRLKEELAELQAQFTQAMFFKQESENKAMRIRELDRKAEDLEEEIRLRQGKEAALNKLVSQLKQKLLEADTDRSKKQNLIKEKDKSIALLNKQAVQQSEERKKESTRREQEHKTAVDDLKEALRKQKSIVEELRVELEKSESNVSNMKSSCDKFMEKIEKLTHELKSEKDNQRFLQQEKEELIKSKEESEQNNRTLQGINEVLENNLRNGQKELRELRIQFNELENSHRELNKMYQRNSAIGEQILDIVAKLQALATNPHSSRESRLHTTTKDSMSMVNNSIVAGGSDYDRLLEIRRTLAIVESRWRKESELAVEREMNQGRQREAEEKEVERTMSDFNRAKAELNKLRKEKEDLSFEANFLRNQNQQLISKVETLEGDLMTTKTWASQIEMRLKEAQAEISRYEEDTKKNQQKYELMLQESRTLLGERAEKQKKDLTATIRKLESRVEELEEKNFTLELDNQKLVELPKREQENKKLSLKVHELEKLLSGNTQDMQQQLSTLRGQLDEAEWDKKNQDDAFRSATSKFQKTISSLELDVEALQLKLREQGGLLKDKEIAVSKAEETIQRLNHEINSLKMQLQEEKDRLSNLDTRTRAEITKYKTETVQLKLSLENQREKVFSAEEQRILRESLQEELKSKDEQLAQISSKEEKLAEQVFKLTQRLDEMKWEHDQKMEAKDNEIMSIQELMYNMNSKENVRLLKEQEVNEKSRQLESERRAFSREANELRGRLAEFEQQIRILVQQKSDLEEMLNSRKALNENKYLASQENEEKYEEIINILEQENRDLKTQMTDLRSKWTKSFGLMDTKRDRSDGGSLKDGINGFSGSP